RVSLSTGGVAEAVARNKVAYLKADWTRKDAVIAAELARHGRAGVPLYLVYGAGGGEPAILPNILTEGAVVRALDAAAPRCPKATRTTACLRPTPPGPPCTPPPPAPGSAASPACDRKRAV